MSHLAVKHSRGFAHLILIIGVVLVGIVGIGYFAIKNGQIKVNNNNLAVSSPTPTPTPQINETEDLPRDEVLRGWKTYRNEEYGFELMYPENFFIKEYPTREVRGEVFGVSLTDNKWRDQVVPNPSLQIGVMETALSPRGWLEKNFNPSSELPPGGFPEPAVGYRDVQDTTLNGLPAIQFQFLATSGMSESTVIQGNSDTLYRINAISSGLGDFPKELYTQILSTFQFIDEPVN